MHSVLEGLGIGLAACSALILFEDRIDILFAHAFGLMLGQSALLQSAEMTDTSTNL